MAARALTAALITILVSGIAAYAAPADFDFGATVLCYHIVESPQDPRMEISRETFRQQMRYLAMTGYNVIPLRELYEYVAGKRASLPRNAIVVTIDDGWRSTYTEVFPEMKRYGFPFTVFIYPQIVGQTSHALNWKQIKEMSDAGVDFESHSLSHPFLTRRRHAELDQHAYTGWLERELIDSKRLIEHATGKPVLFFAYPFGDYDHFLVDSVGRAGYDAALTCEAGKVRRGSNPLRMHRMVVEKKMDFVSFRHYLGAGSMRLDEMTPQPGVIFDPGQTLTVSAKIPDHGKIDPKSVGMALLSVPGALPFSYDPSTGAISVAAVKEALKGTYQRALVWATDAKSGKRIEASWMFKLPEPRLPVLPAVITDPLHIAPADATPQTQSGTAAVAAPGGSGSGTPSRGQLPRAPKLR
ncbi:MAG TPA: polysaccharide deacetylase family protein [Thermoanaerobaculia bacterium]|jgi:peptidoglycan/xylan/chitin deacetylase (PgdA/CDA1 family)|nr:polysaccharide deacetylase family protein [Thermoanaerobaculia bacterium]